MAFLLHNSKSFSKVELFSIFPKTFLELIFHHQNKNNVVETISYVPEHLKYCTQINEYWLNKNSMSKVELFFIFSETFLELIFTTKIKTNVVETISCFAYQLSKKYCIVSGHLKYYTQLNEYWLNKNAMSEHSIGNKIIIKTKINTLQNYLVLQNS